MPSVESNSGKCFAAPYIFILADLRGVFRRVALRHRSSNEIHLHSSATKSAYLCEKPNGAVNLADEISRQARDDFIFRVAIISSICVDQWLKTGDGRPMTDDR